MILFKYQDSTLKTDYGGISTNLTFAVVLYVIDYAEPGILNTKHGLKKLLS